MRDCSPHPSDVVVNAASVHVTGAHAFVYRRFKSVLQLQQIVKGSVKPLVETPRVRMLPARKSYTHVELTGYWCLGGLRILILLPCDF
jgi:hypothetical protein